MPPGAEAAFAGLRPGFLLLGALGPFRAFGHLKDTIVDADAGFVELQIAALANHEHLQRVAFVDLGLALFRHHHSRFFESFLPVLRGMNIATHGSHLCRLLLPLAKRPSQRFDTAFTAEIDELLESFNVDTDFATNLRYLFKAFVLFYDSVALTRTASPCSCESPRASTSPSSPLNTPRSRS
jgi:hypothetical protein